MSWRNVCRNQGPLTFTIKNDLFVFENITLLIWLTRCLISYLNYYELDWLAKSIKEILGQTENQHLYNYQGGNYHVKDMKNIIYHDFENVLLIINNCILICSDKKWNFLSLICHLKNNVLHAHEILSTSNVSSKSNALVGN